MTAGHTDDQTGTGELLIDPPVSPWSTPDQLRAWLGELRELRQRHAGVPQVVEAIRRHESIALEWLNAQLEERA